MNVVEQSKQVAQKADETLQRVARALGILHRRLHHIKHRRIGTHYGPRRQARPAGRHQVIALEQDALFVIRVVFPLDPVQFTVKVEHAKFVAYKGPLDFAVAKHHLVGGVRLQVDERAHYRTKRHETQVAVIVLAVQALVAAEILVVVRQVQLVSVRHGRDHVVCVKVLQDGLSDDGALAQRVDLRDDLVGQVADIFVF